MNKKVVLAPRYNQRVEDIAARNLLALECRQCGHKGALSAEFLRQNYKPYERIKLVEGEFRCESCNQIGTCHWHVEEIDGQA